MNTLIELSGGRNTDGQLDFCSYTLFSNGATINRVLSANNTYCKVLLRE